MIQWKKCWKYVIFIFWLGQKESCLVSGNRPGENFFITHLPAQSNVYQNIHFLFQKNNEQTNKNNKNKEKTKLKTKKKISGKWIKKNKFAAARVKIFLVTSTFRNKSNFFSLKKVIILGKIHVKMKSFAWPYKETKHIHAPAADLLRTVLE